MLLSSKETHHFISAIDMVTGRHEANILYKREKTNSVIRNLNGEMRSDLEGETDTDYFFFICCEIPCHGEIHVDCQRTTDATV